MISEKKVASDVKFDLSRYEYGIVNFNRIIFVFIIKLPIEIKISN